jgi:hypothetical protein
MGWLTDHPSPILFLATRRLTTMNQENRNFFNVMMRNADPSVMTVNDETIAANEKKNAERRAEQEKNNPPKPGAARIEFNKLRGQLFTLQQDAKGFEIRVNNEAGTVKNLESRLTEALRVKKTHEASGNLLAERTLEHNAQLLENELADARDRLAKEQKNNILAVRALRAFNTEHGARLKDLQKEFA